MIAGNSITNFAGEVLGSLEFQQTLPHEFGKRCFKRLICYRFSSDFPSNVVWASRTSRVWSPSIELVASLYS